VDRRVNFAARLQLGEAFVLRQLDAIAGCIDWIILLQEVLPLPLSFIHLGSDDALDTEVSGVHFFRGIEVDLLLGGGLWSLVDHRLRPLVLNGFEVG